MRTFVDSNRTGIYAAWAQVATGEDRGVYKVAMSVGWNPHFGDLERKTIEAWMRERAEVVRHSVLLGWRVAVAMVLRSRRQAGWLLVCQNSWLVQATRLAVNKGRTSRYRKAIYRLINFFCVE